MLSEEVRVAHLLAVSDHLRNCDGCTDVSWITRADGSRVDFGATVECEHGVVTVYNSMLETPGHGPAQALINVAYRDGFLAPSPTCPGRLRTLLCQRGPFHIPTTEAWNWWRSAAGMYVKAHACPQCHPDSEETS